MYLAQAVAGPLADALSIVVEVMFAEPVGPE